MSGFLKITECKGQHPDADASGHGVVCSLFESGDPQSVRSHLRMANGDMRDQMIPRSWGVTIGDAVTISHVTQPAEPTGRRVGHDSDESVPVLQGTADPGCRRHAPPRDRSLVLPHLPLRPRLALTGGSRGG